MHSAPRCVTGGASRSQRLTPPAGSIGSGVPIRILARPTVAARTPAGPWATAAVGQGPPFRPRPCPPCPLPSDVTGRRAPLSPTRSSSCLPPSRVPRVRHTAARARGTDGARLRDTRSRHRPPPEAEELGTEDALPSQPQGGESRGTAARLPSVQADLDWLLPSLLPGDGKPQVPGRPHLVNACMRKRLGVLDMKVVKETKGEE